MKHLFFLLLALICPMALFAQESKQEEPFNGVITDLVGQPIKGAHIYVVDEKYYARSNKKGEFGLTNVQPADTLHVVYLKEHYAIPVDGRKSIRIRLGDQIEAKEDDDLVALGYGFVKRRENLMPSSGISGEIIRRIGRPSLLQCLEGLVPGLNVSPTGSVSIRGINSINLSSEPLYLVDEVEVSSLDMINPYDVDHIEVLKDASIYGARGANGAILVYTIKGPSK